MDVRTAHKESTIEMGLMEMKELDRTVMSAATYKGSEATLDESLPSSNSSWSFKRAAQSQS
jgi:hypothetical protein